MKYEDATIKGKILEGLKENYHLNSSSIRFIPVGEESYCYVVTDKENIKFFVKYCARPKVVKSIDLVNQLLLELGSFDFVVPPVITNGQTSFPLLQGKIYVYPYIDGQVMNIPNEQFSQELVTQLLGIMVKIHTAKIDVDLPKENFANNFLSEFEQVKSNAQNSEVKKLLEENEQLIREIIKRHTALGEKYQHSKPEFVLTHGDITGLNIIKTDDGLKLTDWDGAMFAPPERDINFLFDVPNFSIDEYLRRAGKNSIDPQLREYYGLQWSLDSIIDNFGKLTDASLNVKDKADCIEEIEQYIGYYK